jgi:DNA-binding transcriptional regulator GbsR (MarR family)
MPPAAALRDWIEELALLYERDGLPRMAGRIFAWLLVCHPPEQTMEDLAAALGGSKASMSTMTRLLVQTGLVERGRRPGERSDRFRIRPDQWERLWETRLQLVRSATAVIERGAALVRHLPPDSRRRVEDLLGQYRFFERELPALVARWRDAQHPRRPAGRRRAPARRLAARRTAGAEGTARRAPRG